MDSNQPPTRRSFIAKHITQSEAVNDPGGGNDHARHSAPLSSVVARVQSKSWTSRSDEKDSFSSHHSSIENRRDSHHHSKRHSSPHHTKSSHSHPASSSSTHGRSSSPGLTESKYSSSRSRGRSRSRSGSRSRDRDRHRSANNSNDHHKSKRSSSRDRFEGSSSRSHSKSDRSYHSESRNKPRHDLDEEGNSYHQSSSSHHQHHHSSRGSRSHSSAINDESHYNSFEMEEGEIEQDDDTSNSANESSYSNYYNSRDNCSREAQKYDWTCYKCGVNNFKRRNQCFKCATDREESEANDTGDEISHSPTNCLILRNLSLNMTGDQILSFIGSLTNVPIKSIRLPRDPLYNSPRGVCYLELHTTLEATKLMSLISSIDTSSLTDGLPSAPLMVSYVRRTSSSVSTPSTATYAASLALAAAQWTNQQQNVSETVKSHGTVNINGTMYQKYPTPDPSKFVLEEKSGFHYDHTTRLYYDSKSKYYYNSLTQQYLLWSPQYATYLPVDSKTGSTTVGPSISAPALTSSTNASGDAGDKINNSNGGQASSQSNKSNPSSAPKADADNKVPIDKKTEKVKTAKSIAKQMEKWAKTLNQRSSAASASIKPMVPSFMKDLKAAQAATEAENNDDPSEAPPEPRVTSFKMSLTSSSSAAAASNATSNNSLTAGSSLSTATSTATEKLDTTAIANILDDGDSDSDEPSDPMTLLREEESKFLDFTKLLCRLCKRQFNSREQLTKHQTVSELHSNNLKTHLKSVLTDHQFKELEKKQNLDKLINSSSYTSSYSSGASGKSNSANEYVDRAKERRRKWGIDVESEPNRIKEKYLDDMAAENAKAAAIASTHQSKPIDSSNRGSKMMKAMGWKEGQGLGKKGTGRTDIIHVEVRAENSGLGMKKAKTTQVVPGESYKDAVKRAMAQRYKELTEQDQE